MKKEKQSKLVAILALCVSVVGLTLGFAAFSNTLTISSSATVSPNESDFNINVYGISDFKGDTYAGTNSLPPIELYTSETTSVANKSSSINPALASSDSKITDNGKSITITDINVGLTEPGQQVSYYYLIKNEGEYDAYLDMTKVGVGEFTLPREGTCTAEEGVTPELLEKACHNVYLSPILATSDGEGVQGGEYLKIAKGDYLLLELNIFYHQSGDRADGPFNIKFDDIRLEFTSVPPTEQ